MAAELERVRPDFVKKASKEVIKQLLDYLLKDGVLNNGEKDSVLEENSSRSDKARSLIDTVKLKGDKASMKMISHLQSLDSTLYAELRLSSDQPTQPASQEKQACSSTSQLVASSRPYDAPKLSTKQYSDKDVYPVNKDSIKNRVALLITNKEFSDETLNRKGAETDEKNMKELLRALGYNVIEYNNLTAQEMDEALIHFSTHPKLARTDSVFVVIMSHGKRGVILGVNWKKTPPPGEKPDEFPIDNIYKHLNTKGCQKLMDKPKVIIIQACRGVNTGSVFVSDGPQPGHSLLDAETDIEEDTVRRVHTEKDFISLLSCTPDTVSYRSVEDGSFLIQHVVSVFNEFSKQDDIEELFRKVMQRFDDSSTRVIQMPTKDRATLPRRFYLFPNI